ncbi:MAG: hypothetical protein ACOYI8_06940 [Christensenellales bacterium]|jgi:hypothetical protein
MLTILLWTSIGVFGLALACVGAYFYSAKWIEILYVRDREDLDYILDTRGVPARWCKKYVRRVERMREKGADAESIERVRARANAYYLKRMKRIQAFARTDFYYQYNKTAKAAVQRDLNAIYTQWERREYLHEPY